MTRTIDPKRRLVLPDHFHSGDVVEMQTDGQDVLIIRRMKAARRQPHKMRLVRSNGFAVIAGGPGITSEDVKRIMEDFP